ncbi:MAG: hypothetical protein D6696_12200 [Acidobacteria bacterium]|nr:MAG: hypothetical protein D6696_12200 [Acidobacteriota bacterium]
MEFVRRLLGRDPAAELARGERLLARGEPSRALEVGRKLLARLESGRSAAQAGNAGPARDLVARARQGVVELARAKAREAEASGYLEDAVEWLGMALAALEEASSQRSVLAAERAALLARLERGEEEPAPFDAGSDEPDEEPFADLDPRGAGEDDAATLYHNLVAMFADEVAPHYEHQGAAFRRAFVDLNQGRFEAAREVFEALDASDPVVRLERARCRLAAGEAEAARRDLEALWEVFGDLPLDRGGSLSIPLLWAEAALAAGDPKAVLARLESLAEPASNRPELTLRWAQALVELERLEEARGFLTRAAHHFGLADFALPLARVLARLGERRLAIDCLETAIAPSCAAGRCGAPAKHPPSLRALIELYLEAGNEDDLERADQLMWHVGEAQNGRLTSADLAQRARYHQLRGETELAARAAAEADRRRGQEAEQAAVAPELRSMDAVL